MRTEFETVTDNSVTYKFSSMTKTEATKILRRIFNEVTPQITDPEEYEVVADAMLLMILKFEDYAPD